MHKLKLALGLILVFLVGALAGSLGTGMYIGHRIEKFAASGPRHPARTASLMKRLSNELDLTDAQRAEVEKIVEEYQEKIFAVRRKYLPDIEEITDESFALMKAKLNPYQKEKLEELHEKLKDRHARAFIRSIQTEETSDQVLSEMKERLNLAAEQEIKVRPIIERSVRERRTILEKCKEQDHPDIFSVRREMRELEKSVEKRLAEILTKEQMEEYRRIQEERDLEKRSEMHRRKSVD